MLDELISRCRSSRVVALTGAGISTESGIPDYRGPGPASTRARLRKPIQHGEFLGSAEVRQRYWARSFLGLSTISTAEPNAGHKALAELEDSGALAGIITQNVDRLHTKAGSRKVIELHGALADVVCLDCGAKSSRRELQDRLALANPRWAELASKRQTIGVARPDGDRELDETPIESFEVQACNSCGGALKPDVVFFGGAVDKGVLETAWSLYRQCDLLLVVGSSLAVFSGFRFVRQAEKDGTTVAIINRGESRGDSIAQIRLDAPAGATLTELRAALMARPTV